MELLGEGTLNSKCDASTTKYRPCTFTDINRFYSTDEAIQHLSDEHQKSTQIMHLKFSVLTLYLCGSSGRHTNRCVPHALLKGTNTTNNIATGVENMYQRE